MASTRTFAVSADTLLALQSGTAVGGGADAHLPVGYWDSTHFRAALQFTTNFTGMTSITSAVLSIKTTGQQHVGFGSDPDVIVRRLTKSWAGSINDAKSSYDGGGGWSATGIDWNSLDNEWTTDGQASKAIPETEGTWVDITITNIVKAWAPTTIPGGLAQANYGIIIVPATYGAGSETTEFYSQNSAYDPYITVTYESNVAPNAPVFTSPASDTSVVENANPVYGTPPTGFSIDFNFNEGISYYDLQVGTTLDGSNLLNLVNQTGSGATAFIVTYNGSALTRGSTVYIRARGQDAGGLWSAYGYRTFIVNDTSLPTVGVANNSVVPLTYTSGWTSPRMSVSHTYNSDPNGHTQLKYLWRIYSDSAGSKGAIAFTDSWVDGTGTTRVIPYNLTNGSYYWLTVETQDQLGLSKGESTAVRVRARWGRAAFHSGSLGSTPASWSVSASPYAPANTAVVIEYGSNSSATAPGSYTTNFASVARNTYFHYRVWLMAWGSSPVTPSVSRVALTYTTSTLDLDNWTLPGGTSVDTSAFVYGTQSLKHSNTGAAIETRQTVSVTKNTNYVLSGRIRGDGAAAASIRITSVGSSTELVTTTDTNDTNEGWVTVYTAVWNSGTATEVDVVARSAGPAGSYAWFDALKMEASKVVTAWTPAFISSGVVADAGGVQIDASNNKEGLFRLRASSAGSNARAIVELGSSGLKFGGDTELYSVSAGLLGISKAGGTTSGIYFPAQSNDPGRIEHIENSNAAEMRFSVSDDYSGDWFTFGCHYSGASGAWRERFGVDASGYMAWSADGTTPGRDTNLYRAGTDHLKTDDQFTVGSTLYALGDVNVTGSVIGTMPKITNFTTVGTTSWSKTGNPAYIIVECQGGGGGGGGVAGVDTGAGAAGGGGGGGYSKKMIPGSLLSGSYTVVVGGGGTAGSSAAGAGGTGGASTFAGANITTVSGNGGGGGSGDTAASTFQNTAGGDGGGWSGGDIGRGGDDGCMGLRGGNDPYTQSFGGGSMLGGQQRGSGSANAAGVAGSNYGGGASGAITNNSATNYAGAAGAQGIVIVTEYYGP